MIQQYEGAPGNGVNSNGSGQSLGRHFLSKQELALAIGVCPRTIDSWMAQEADTVSSPFSEAHQIQLRAG